MTRCVRLSWVLLWLAACNPAPPAAVGDASADVAGTVDVVVDAADGAVDAADAAGTQDASGSDVSVPDSSDGATDVPTADGQASDAPSPDVAMPDAAMPDAAMPDATSPDAQAPDAPSADAGASDGASADTLGSDVSPAPCAKDSDCPADQRCVGTACVDALEVWPNAQSAANSDPWLPQHHADIVQLRPRILAINFVNKKSNAQMLQHLDSIFAAMAEMSRPRGDVDPSAAPMWVPTVAYAVDLRDQPPPPGWKWGNSTHYPREQPKQGYWGFDYEQLFTPAFAAKLKIADPNKPGAVLDVCELINAGLVHEVWIYGDADVAGDVNAAELLERKPRYDAKRQRLAGVPMDGCAGNGCFDAEDTFPAACNRTVRVAWVNHNRGPGCFLESLSHGMESTGTRKPALVPYLSAEFPAFAGFDLNVKYSLPFTSWYTCEPGKDCLSYPTATSVTYDVGTGPKTLTNYDAVCGNAHFAPNGRKHYDLGGTATVQTSCRHFRQGGGAGGADLKGAFTTADFSGYKTVAPDCMGSFLVWWWQQMPGVGTKATHSDGSPMLSWLPFVYY